MRGRVVAAWQAVVAHHLATARVFIVDDYFFPITWFSRGGDHDRQTWHACGAFKKVGYSVLDKSFGVDGRWPAADPLELRRHLVHAVRRAALRGGIRQPSHRFVSRLGIPRTDVFFGEERLARTREASQPLRLTDDRRVVLTPRHSGATASPMRTRPTTSVSTSARDAGR